MSDEEHSDSEFYHLKSKKRQRGKLVAVGEASGDTGYEKLVPVVAINAIFVIKSIINYLLISAVRSLR